MKELGRGAAQRVGQIIPKCHGGTARVGTAPAAMQYPIPSGRRVQTSWRRFVNSLQNKQTYRHYSVYSTIAGSSDRGKPKVSSYVQYRLHHRKFAYYQKRWP